MFQVSWGTKLEKANSFVLNFNKNDWVAINVGFTDTITS